MHYTTLMLLLPRVDSRADAKAVGDKLALLIGGDEPREITGWTYGKWINTGSAVEIGDTVDITNFTDWFSLKHVVVECQEGDRFLLVHKDKCKSVCVFNKR